MNIPSLRSMSKLREAFEASWDADTAFENAYEEGNPALGNCYPTSRALQLLFPKLEIAEGRVWTGKREEKHFWNILSVDGIEYHVDFTWQQFPHGSSVKKYWIRDRETLGDREATKKRVEILLKRVLEQLNQQK